MNKTKEEILFNAGALHVINDHKFYTEASVLDCMDKYTSHLTDQIKSMENYISDVDGQVKDKNEEIARLRFDYDACYGQLESLQKEVIEFAEWLDKEGYYRLNDGRWSINILGRANEEFTTQELYKIYKPS